MTPIRLFTLLLTFISVCFAQEPLQPASSTESPSTTNVKYVIWAKEGTSKADADGFYNTLVDIVGNKNSIESILNEKDVPYVWRTSLTAAQLERVNADRVVGSAKPDEELSDRDLGDTTANKRRADTKQLPARGHPIIDLRMLSTPPGDPLNEYYGYDDTAGEGITIYIIDSGPFGFAHAELQPLDSSITRENINVLKHPYAFNDDSGHGTCVVSKAVGKTVGVAKRANLVTVRIDLTPGEFDLIKTWQTVRNDIEKKGLHGKAVVSSSVGTRPSRDAEANRTKMSNLARIIRSIMDADVPVICAAGNDADKPGGRIEPHTLPSVLARGLPVIVVGAATANGEMASFSQRGDLLTTWAVGEDILCADLNTVDGLHTDSGTSFAAPQIAGLAAYFMANPEFKDELKKGSVAKDMQTLIRTYSHPRGSTKNHPDIAWNGFDPAASTSKRIRRSPGPAVRRRRAAAASSRRMRSV